MFVYLDNSATTRQYDEVTRQMKEAMDDFYGNPSALHSLGLASEKKIRAARQNLASALGAKEEEIVFTSGGTESDNMALYGIAQAKKREGKKIITSKVEHPAVLEACKVLEKEGFDVTYIGVDDQCRLDTTQLRAAIDDQTTLISIMAVNNETGTIMPVEEISRLKGRSILHVDAVQGFGKISLQGLGADLISVSAHKIHGPKGIGALYVKKGVNLPAFIVGGGQERHMRSGTENVPGIIGFGAACQIAMSDIDGRMEKMAAARNYLLAGICDQISDIRVNSPEDGAASVLNISFLGTRGEVLLHTLEQDQIFVSTGSACSSNKKGGSHVLAAMGLSDKEIEGAIRFSFNEFNTTEEMDYVIAKVKTAVKRFRRLGSFR
ncbi:MAG: cysteine desulfurase family protein [Emergencia timonensis]|uniref:cysteine desulfurase family protein n=1 Tax=Emergencia timonensis TaxID=1776384 RepID=UPI0008316347|nr:cysteine desulfurase family protein [Emergencia timonensis]WNX90236.1 cysteine desulfurase family protein [Emergencia timonensis]